MRAGYEWSFACGLRVGGLRQNPRSSVGEGEERGRGDGGDAEEEGVVLMGGVA